MLLVLWALMLTAVHLRPFAHFLPVSFSPREASMDFILLMNSGFGNFLIIFLIISDLSSIGG